MKRKFTDAQLVECYLKTKSQNKAAERLGCSRETVARAVRRVGIPLNGRRNDGDHKGNGGGGSPCKITDAELITEAKVMTRNEIAEKHKMCICNVDRKLSRLKIHCVPADAHPTVGIKRGGKYYGRVRAAGFGAEYDGSVTLAKLVKRHSGICQLCGKPVDKMDRRDGHIGYWYPTIDHVIPISAGGSHTWDNVQLAHMICNSKKGAQYAAEVI